MSLQPESVHIWRTESGVHHLDWETSHPDTVVECALLAGGEAARLVAETGGAGRLRVEGLAANARYFFRLRDQHGSDVVAAARGQGVAGAVNFRDFGGYPTASGHQVSWGRLFRSGHLSSLTAAGVAQLGALEIDLICDFRREDECVQEPSRLPAKGQRPHTVNLAITPGSQGSAIYNDSRSIDSRDAMFAFMVDINRQFVAEQSERYAQMFGEILQPGVNRLLVHCAAGKDRTGFAAALLLLALGVPEHLVMRDYLLTQHYFDPWAEMDRVRQKYPINHLSDEDLLPMLSVHEAYLQAALSAVKQEYGGIDTYLGDVLGLGHAERAELATRFLDAEPAGVTLP